MRELRSDHEGLLPPSRHHNPRHNPTSEQTAPANDAPAAHHRSAKLAATAGWVVLAVALLALVGEAITLFILFQERDYTGRIYPNISIGDVAVGGQPIEYAREQLRQRYADFLRHPITLVYNDHAWQPSVQELGITLDIDAAIQEAAAIGRSETRASNSRTIAAVWNEGEVVPLHIQVDQATMQRYLSGIAQQVETPPQSAGVVLQGAEVVVMPDKAGLQLLADETMQEIISRVAYLEPQHITLRTRKLAPMLGYDDAAVTAAEVREMIDTSIVLTATSAACEAGTCRWEWSPEQIADWLQIQQSYTVLGRPRLEPVINQAAIRRDLLPIAEALHQVGSLPRVNWNEDGTMTIFRNGTNGQGLNVAQALQQINAALQRSTAPRTIALSQVAIPPPINEVNLASLSISDFVGVGISSFAGSAGYRITNIREGARRMHGILIPPGAEFSFNTNLGEVGAGSGFVQGEAIVQDRIQWEWGGGLCQVSTTMFRAAFWTGLPITERHEHSFRIGWYEELGEPPGFDATIYTGWNDLRFVNDTGTWLLTQTWVDFNRQRLYISLLGAPTGRDVKIGHRVLQWTAPIFTPRYVDDPSLPGGTLKQTDWATDGLTVHLYRTVLQNGEVIREDTFPTTFESRSDVYVRGTGGW